MEPQSTGGEVAEAGFDFQTHALLQKLPAWLAREGFSAFTCESMGDMEAKFFVPGHGERIEFLEAKNYQLPAKGFWEELRRFHDLETASPGTFANFTLVCNGLPQEVATLWRLLERIRKPAEFYGQDSGIFENSWREFEQRVLDAGWTKDGARFVFEKVFVQSDAGGLRTQGEALFAKSFIEHQPRFADAPHRKIVEVYQSLRALIGGRINAPVSRSEIEAVLWQHLPSFDEPEVIRFEIITTTPPKSWDDAIAIIFDWRESFAGFPEADNPTARWNGEVTSALRQTASWLKGHRRQRRIQLSGTPRLSQAFAVGATFPAVAGFELDFIYRQGVVWSTDCHPDATTPAFQHTLAERPGAPGSDAVVTIGILRPIADEVQTFTESTGLATVPALHLQSPGAILDPRHANLAVREIKERMADFSRRTGAAQLHLFLAMPAPLALFLGHRVNAVCRHLQCYERVSPGRYVQTASL